jgi:uncharacterized protein (DUF58 family)
MASHFRGRGHELHSLREYLPTDSARFVDWKVTAKIGRMAVREFAREDERRVMLVVDPFVGPSPRVERNGADRGDKTASAPGQHTAADRAAMDYNERFERAVSMAACIAWHFHEIRSVMQFRTDRYVTEVAPAGEIIYETLRTLALLQPETSATGGAFLDTLVNDREIFRIIITARPQRSIPTALWSSSYFLFIDRL